MRRLATSLPLLLVLILASPGAARAQTLAGEFSGLFTFGDCGEPLCLPVNQAVHGDHYIPSVAQGETNLLAFLRGAISTGLANLPVTSATSGATFTFEGGVPVRSTVSAGPIFGERAQTLGRGRILVGVNLNGISFSEIRGIPLDELSMTFVHENVGESALGDPTFENDLVAVDASLDLSLVVTTLFASYGISDDVDAGILLPIVRSSLSGSSTARIQPYENTTPHAFGSESDPRAVATGGADASAFGPGDVGLRVKANLHQGDVVGAALLGDLRLPTGDEADFLGSGEASLRVLSIVSARYGDLTPHLNAGFALRGGDVQGNSLLLTAGFDHLASESVTLALDVVSDLSVGDPALLLPEPAVFTSPEVRTVELTDIPGGSDDLVDASFGLKIDLPGGYRVVGNALVPVSEGGLRPSVLWTLGAERTF